MLHRTAHPDGTITYQSPLLAGIGVSHAFSTRGFELAQTAAAVGLGGHQVLRVKQVHGTAVERTGGCEADAIVVDQSDRSGALPGAACVVTADCVPILLATPNGKAVAAVHAGWRGLVAGVIEAAVEELGQPFIAAVGPCISVNHFEVGQEVADQFDPAFVHTDLGERPHIDLRAAAVHRLKQSGAQAVDTTDRCTYEHTREFYSYRREVTHNGDAATGRMFAIIAPL